MNKPFETRRARVNPGEVTLREHNSKDRPACPVRMCHRELNKQLRTAPCAQYAYVWKLGSTQPDQDVRRSNHRIAPRAQYASDVPTQTTNSEIVRRAQSNAWLVQDEPTIELMRFTREITGQDRPACPVRMCNRDPKSELKDRPACPVRICVVRHHCKPPWTTKSTFTPIPLSPH